MIKPARSIVLVAAAALALTACGGNGNSSTKAAQSQLSAIQSAVAQGKSAASSTPSSDSPMSSDSPGSETDPTSVDQLEKSAESQLSAIESAVAHGTNPSDDATTPDPSVSGDLPTSSSPAGSGPNPASIDVCALLTPADANAVARADKLDDAQTASTVYKLMASKATGGEGDSACRFTILDQTQERIVLFQVSKGSDIYLYNDGTKVAGLGDEAYTNSNGGTVVRVGGLLLSEGDNTFSSAMTIDLLRKIAPRLN